MTFLSSTQTKIQFHQQTDGSPKPRASLCCCWVAKRKKIWPFKFYCFGNVQNSNSFGNLFSKWPTSQYKREESKDRRRVRVLLAFGFKFYPTARVAIEDSNACVPVLLLQLVVIQKVAFATAPPAFFCYSLFARIVHHGPTDSTLSYMYLFLANRCAPSTNPLDGWKMDGRMEGQSSYLTQTTLSRHLLWDLPQNQAASTTSSLRIVVAPSTKQTQTDSYRRRILVMCFPEYPTTDHVLCVSIRFCICPQKVRYIFCAFKSFDHSSIAVRCKMLEIFDTLKTWIK